MTSTVCLSMVCNYLYFHCQHFGRELKNLVIIDNWNFVNFIQKLIQQQIFFSIFAEIFQYTLFAIASSIGVMQTDVFKAGTHSWKKGELFVVNASEWRAPICVYCIHNSLSSFASKLDNMIFSRDLFKLKGFMLSWYQR